ncbi:DUF1080 domain-containing protein [Saccharophagus degradans]|uniref:3-keto-disaccharide hydrolase n=1 Tax=Saccharophagus degradans TaxID=86304 RepID=UPI001C08028D|nr:DUF1080 domain-containing protein [Saccharophagus degradans]MBU2985094.1 DUF1080 domain-containing protein [Saccharophagus degradans]
MKITPIIYLVLALIISPLNANAAEQQGWQSLFNGKNLDGWEPYVSFQPETNEYLLVSKHTPRGINNDPKGVFSVVDGLLRVSGEEWGGLTSHAEFERFHLMFDIKWGDKKWPPRLGVVRDSGLLYYAVGPHGAQSSHWMRSHEFQIQEGDCGDYHSLDGALIDVHAGNANQGDWHFYRYDPSLPLQKNISSRVLKLGNYEKPHGEWNTMEVIADGKTLIHKVNGKEVFRAFNSRQKQGDEIKPLLKGKLQIQSEGAEVFYKNIKIKKLP